MILLILAVGVIAISNGQEQSKQTVLERLEKLEKLVEQQAQQIIQLTKTQTPVGTIISFIGAQIPEGYLPCDGTEIPEKFDELRKLVGTTTPDLRGRFLLGVGKYGISSPKITGGTEEHTHVYAKWHSGDWQHLIGLRHAGAQILAPTVSIESNVVLKWYERSEAWNGGNISTLPASTLPPFYSVLYCIKY